jgi:hypothetical protein
MQRDQLEHVIRAAAAITGAKELVVIGSQAILGQFPDPPRELTISVEADLFTWRDPAGSPFHQTFGYHAHGVGEETAILPSGWKERLIPVSTANTGGAIGLCLEVHDLAVSKLVAGREKDMDFVHALAQHKLIDIELLRTRLSRTTLDDAMRTLCSARISRLFD